MKVIDFKNARCRHCYKCVRYCEVKAISVQNEQARIMENRCIHCGQCLEVCPQNAKIFASDLERVKGYLKNGKRVIISLDPAYLSVLDFDHPGQVAEALKRLGFTEVRETAEGAALMTAEYRRLLREGKQKNIITTCCPGITDLIEKYYPALTPMLAPLVSPMIAHGRMIRNQYGPEVKIVYLGPCIARKLEAVGDERVEGAFNAILTFEEIQVWWKEAGIRLKECQEAAFGNASPGIHQLCAMTGGITTAILADGGKDPYYKIQADGIKTCMEILKELKRGRVEGCFFELNLCKGGCVKGPASNRQRRSQLRARMTLEGRITDRSDAAADWGIGIMTDKHFESREIRDRYPTGTEITEILHAMGKYSREDELNCGACGYATCREKAVAVFQGKAETGMCLPYVIAQAESLSNVVMNATPNVIIVVNQELRIRECNKLGQRKLGVSRKEALERYLFEFVETDDAEQVLTEKESILRKKVRLDSLNMIAMESIVYIDSIDSALIIYQDITREEKAREQHLRLKMETVEIAQRVIDKQMMVAQEIAGLLGETTAETKVTLSKLRDSILDDGEEQYAAPEHDAERDRFGPEGWRR